MYRLLLLLCLVSVLASCQSEQLQVKDLESKRIVFLGDSITDNGLYVSFIEYHFIKQGIEADIISVGLSSETTSGLSEKAHPFPRPCIHSRLDDVLRLTKPDIVVACYGMNDGIYHPQSRERLLAYKIGVQQLIAKVESTGAKMILMTPPPFDALPVKNKTVAVDSADFSYKTPFEGYNSVLNDYANWLKSLDYTVVDQNTSLQGFLENKRQSDPQFSFGKDGIHPDSPGHLLMAYNFLETTGMTIDRSNLLNNEQSIVNEKLFKMIHQRRKMRSKGWLEYIGYNRGKVVKKKSVKETEVLAKKLRNEIMAELQNQ